MASPPTTSPPKPLTDDVIPLEEVGDKDGAAAIMKSLDDAGGSSNESGITHTVKADALPAPTQPPIDQALAKRCAQVFESGSLLVKMIKMLDDMKDQKLGSAAAGVRLARAIQVYADGNLEKLRLAEDCVLIAKGIRIAMNSMPSAGPADTTSSAKGKAKPAAAPVATGPAAPKPAAAATPGKKHWWSKKT